MCLQQQLYLILMENEKNGLVKWVQTDVASNVFWFKKIFLWLIKEGEPWRSGKVVALWPWSHGFKSWKQPLAGKVVYIRPKVVGLFSGPCASGSYVHRAALWPIKQVPAGQPKESFYFISSSSIVSKWTPINNFASANPNTQQETLRFKLAQFAKCVYASCLFRNLDVIEQTKNNWSYIQW
jgi:hypothetical protein